jgi:asparagine synthetase B (glutamine-hydrolysing)
MCGICGVIDWTGSGDASAIVRRMTPTMHHRGPDDMGISDFGFRISEFGQRAKSEGQNDLGISNFEFRNSDLERLHHRDKENTEDAQRISDFEFRNSNLGQRAKGEEQGAGSEGQGNFRKSDLGGSISIGMTRLSIIDIEGGHQPVFNEDGKVGAMLNGEIYNFQELRRQLEDRGHTFRTRSDSEVVVHAYEEWGEECVERFEGMFAIAVWDRRSSEFRVPSSETREARSSEFRVPSSELNAGHSATLFLARDRLGIKPLYYYAQGAEFRVPSSRGEFRVPSSEFRVKTESQNVRGTKLRVHESEAPGSQRETRNSKLETNTLELETRNSKLETNILEPETRNSKLETFLFASEVRTLLASGVVPRQLSKTALESYLLFGSVSEPMTLIEGVLSIPPGHRMTINLADASAPIHPQSYWNIAHQPSVNGQVKRNHAADMAARVRQLLADSVRKHLIADVPVGVFLSSGIDSTALAALASREAAGVHTFTVAFPEKEFSEAEIARRTAATFGTTHQELMLSGDQMLARLSEAVNALDQPSMDGINTYFVSWGAAQAGLKVAISGLGGDEVFGGYNTFSRTAHFQRLAAIGGILRQSLRAAVA